MASLSETDDWEDGIYQIELTDPVVGGPPNVLTGAGLSNLPHQQLAKRTSWLKSQIIAIQAAIAGATTTVAGIVRLSTSTNSASTTMAATPSAVKAVNDAVALRAMSAVQITGAGLATGGGNLTANRAINVPAATQGEAEAGISNSVVMTPLRTAQAVEAMTAGIGSKLFVLAETFANGVSSSVVLAATAWTKRILASQHNTLPGASVAAGVVTLPPGTYRVDATAVTSNGPNAGAWPKTVLRLRNVTAGTTLAVGVQGQAFNGDYGFGFGRTSLSAAFTIVAEASIELQQWSASLMNGGDACSTGEVEVYATLTINKIA